MIATNRKASFQRVVSKHDQDFGASNVIPAATPLIAAKGWDDDDGDGDGDGDSEMVEETEDIEKEENDPEETEHRSSGPQKDEKAKEEATTTTVTTYVSNPLKRPRSKEQGVTSERALVVRAGDAAMLEKKRFIEPIVPKCLESILKIELKRIFKVVNLINQR